MARFAIEVCLPYSIITLLCWLCQAVSRAKRKQSVWWCPFICLSVFLSVSLSIISREPASWFTLSTLSHSQCGTDTAGVRSAQGKDVSKNLGHIRHRLCTSSGCSCTHRNGLNGCGPPKNWPYNSNSHKLLIVLSVSDNNCIYMALYDVCTLLCGVFRFV